MRWDSLAEPIDGLAGALAVVDGFDEALRDGLGRPGPDQVAAIAALAAAVAGTPLADRVAESVEKVTAGSISEDHLAALAGARCALLGAAHDALLARVDGATGHVRQAWPEPPVAPVSGVDNLLAAARSWLADVAIAGWRGIDHDLVAGAAQAVHALLAEVRLRRLAVLLDGFAAELRASCPVATLPRVPLRRWADLWSRAVLLSRPGFAVAAAAPTSGRFLPLGVDLHEHATAVQAQVHGILEPDGGGPARLVRASVSATKPDTIVGPGVWWLHAAHPVLLAALGEHRAVEIAGMPLAPSGDLIWHDGSATAGAPADPFTTARVGLATATASPVPPLDRHPVGIAVPVLLDGYTMDGSGGGLRIGGFPLAVEADRLPAAGPLTPALIAASTAMIALLRWDAGRWSVRPIGVRATVKRKPVEVHTGDWATGATGTAAKAESAAGDAVAVLRERAGRLLRR